MFPHEIFFFSTLFFITGVLLKSFGFGSLVFIFCLSTAAILIVFGIIRKKKFFFVAPLAIFIFVGAFYYTYDDIKFKKSVDLNFEDRVVFLGFVDSNPKYTPTFTESVLHITSGGAGRILQRTESGIEIEYGDELRVFGRLEKPEGSYAKYLEKERISGVIAYPKVQETGEKRGKVWKAVLYGLKNKVQDSFYKYFSPKEAAFLGGLTLGSKAGFDKTFKEKLQRSGTSHLVALSGHNITVIANAVNAVLLLFMRKKRALIFVSLIILSFVIMTGGEASVVRAAILALILFFGREYGKAHDLKNVILFVALLMILINPKVLVFDLGFQLSFLAFIGITYLSPVFKNVFLLGEKKRKSIFISITCDTISAQIMVAPILMSQFGFISLIGVFSNLAIFWFIPYTMTLGFLVAGAHFVSPIIAYFLSLITKPILSLELLIIEVGSRLDFPISLPFNWITMVGYYLALFFLLSYGIHFSRNSYQS